MFTLWQRVGHALADDSRVIIYLQNLKIYTTISCVLNNVTDRLWVTGSRRGRRFLNPDGELTDRKREVLALLCEGMTQRKIGELLGISHSTVEFHCATMHRLWRVKNTAMLVRKAIRLGVIKP